MGSMSSLHTMAWCAFKQQVAITLLHDSLNLCSGARTPSAAEVSVWSSQQRSCQVCALQGFASGDLERDATAVRMFTDAGVELIHSQVLFT